MRTRFAILSLIIGIILIPHGAAARPASATSAVTDALPAMQPASEILSMGCKTDTVAAIPGYYATGKTCIERWVGHVGNLRGHSVTRCYGSNHVAVKCRVINGDTVYTRLYHGDISTNRWQLAEDAYPDSDCGSCHENSHYSYWLCDYQMVGEDFWVKVSGIRVQFPNGTLSSHHNHTSYAVGPMNGCG
jgi:hypothetical protein